MSRIKSMIDINVCHDCIMLIANGDIPEDNPTLAHKIDLWWPSEQGWVLVMSGYGDDEGNEFSWAQCDGCGSTLGGARYPAVAIQD